MTENPAQLQNSPRSTTPVENIELTEEMVEKIVERVYCMIISDLKLEYERGCGFNSDFHRGIR